MTYLLGASAHISDFSTNESYTIPQPVNSLPTKRLFDHRFKRLKESTKFPREYRLDNLDRIESLVFDDYSYPDEVLLKIKMIGVNFKRDFELLKHKKPSRSHQDIVPGNKIIGKIMNTSKNPNSIKFTGNHKYLVFPYSNCILQSDKSESHCINCKSLLSLKASTLTKKTFSAHKNLKCLKRWEYGYNIDGGLQDFIKIRRPAETLVKIPENISLHDCCFSLEITLPFYSFIKETLSSSSQVPEAPFTNDGKVLIILNNMSREMNDILVVLKHFDVDQKLFRIIDAPQIRELMNSSVDYERATYKSKFNHVFVFSIDEYTIPFALYSIISTGLESTKSRYNLALFDQYDPANSAKYKTLHKYHPDKTIHHYELSYKDRINAIDLLDIIASLNDHSEDHSTNGIKRDTSVHPCSNDSEARPSVTSIETAASTFSNMSFHSDSTSSTAASITKENNFSKSTKHIRFRDNESIIDYDAQSHKSANARQQQHFSWLHYDKDFDLCTDYEYSDDGSDDDDDYREEKSLNSMRNNNHARRSKRQSRRKMHTIRHMNGLIHSNSYLTRVCYTNRTNKPVKINAFIFS